MENLLLGLQELADPQVLLFILIGGVVGLLAGAIPGLNDTNILTLFLSFVVFLDPFPAVILMTAVFIACQTAGSIPAILINIPGTPSTAASTLEGYQLTKRGLAGQAAAMDAAVFHSFRLSLIHI